MIKLIYFNFKKEEKIFLKNKIFKKPKITKKFFQYYLIEKYFCDNFLFFLLHINLKKCFFFKLSKLKNFSKFFTRKGVNFRFFHLVNHSTINQTFSNRIRVNKELFSLNFLIFPLEVKIPIRNFLNFVFIKKKPKF
jgi:hypothetical protein